MSGCKARETTRLLDRACPRRLPNREVAVSLYSVGKKAMLTWRQSGSAYADVVQATSRQLFEVSRDGKAAGASRVTRALEIGERYSNHSSGHSNWRWPAITCCRIASPHVKHGLSIASHAMAKAHAHFFDLFLIGANFVQRAAVVNLRASLRKTCSLRDQSVAPPDTRTHSPVT
jgi:hypothetical protein